MDIKPVFAALLCLACSLGLVDTSHAGGGYFALGYGPTARQMAGATTAYGQDAYAGSFNPAKWLAAGNRIDIGTDFFLPYRRVERTGSNTVQHCNWYLPLTISASILAACAPMPMVY